MRVGTLAVTIITCVFLLAPCAFPDDAAQEESAAAKDARMEWWRDARFGLFIHWGLYAVPAGEWGGKKDYGEWIREEAKIPVGEYEKLRDRFNPVQFDAKDWVEQAKAAGVRYITITSKHHDGFGLFDSAQTDWDVMSTPFKRDILGELSAACAAEDMPLCFYHSIMDWHHPDYLPRRPWERAERPEGDADMDRYVAYMKAQIRELMTNYGKIGVMWFDGEWEDTWTHERGVDLYQFVRGQDPDIIVNNRVDKGREGMAGMSAEGFVGDFGTPEQEIPATGLPGVDWETCMTMNKHWGYNAADKDFKSTRDLIRKLVEIVSKGGNFLLNVGPMANGEFPPESVTRLAEIGKWMEVNGESIYGTGASPIADTPWGRCTQKQNSDGTTTLYLHILDWPKKGCLRLGEGIANVAEGRAYLLADPASALPITVTKKGKVEIALPREAPDEIDTVLVLEYAPS